MHRFKLLYFVIFIINLYRIYAQISDKRLCVDEECKVPISHAKTLLRYSSPDSRILSFGPNVDITIYSKSAGSREDLWGGEINGKRGYIPKHMVRETKLLQKPTLLVDTEFSNATETKQVPSQVEPDKVQEPYEIVDGTTIYLNPQENISPSSTESPIQSTALPVYTNKISQSDEVLKTESNPTLDQKENVVSNKIEVDSDIEESNENEQSDEDEPEDEDNEVDVDEESEEDDELLEAGSSKQDQTNINEEKVNLKNDDKSGEAEEKTNSSEGKAEVPNSLENEAGAPEPVDHPETVLQQEEIKSEEPVIIESNEDKVEVMQKLPTAESILDSVPITLSTDASQVEETVETNKDVKNENLHVEGAVNIEATTLIPELEVPQPFDDSYIDVTPNPLDVTDEPIKETISALPPLSLFSGANPDFASSSNAKPEDLLQKTVETVASAALKDQNSVKPEVLDEAIKTEKNELSHESKVEEIKEKHDDSKENIEHVTEGFPRENEQPIYEENYSSASQESNQLAVEESNQSLDSEIEQQPSEEASQPIEETSQLIEETSQPIEETIQPIEETIQPIEETIQPIEETIQPIEETIQPIEETIQPIEETIQPIEETIQPIEETSQASEETIQPSDETNYASEETNRQTSEENVNHKNDDADKSGGLFSGILSLFGLGSGGSINEEQRAENEDLTFSSAVSKEIPVDPYPSGGESFCEATSCRTSAMNEQPVETIGMDFFNFSSDIFLYLVTTAISVIIFLFGYLALDKSKREGPLIAKINKLEKDLLIVLKENQILQEKLSTESGYETNDKVSNEAYDNLQQELLEMTSLKNVLEEQVQSLEKELENSTEVGMELNRMLSEILRSESGSDVLKANVENLQRQLIEQQATINSVNETLAVTNTENHELRLELELSNKKVIDLQTELDKLLLNILKIEEEKETQQSNLESEIANLRQRYEQINHQLRLKEDSHQTELKQIQNRLDQAERKFELKSKEYEVLADTLKQLKAVKNNESTLQNLLEVSGTKAEYQLLKTENQRLTEKLQQEQELKSGYEKKAQTAVEEIQQLQQKYDEVDKLKVETQTKLEVLSNYFKDREAQWQKEISKHEALWAEKEGEATSTTERIQFMQEQLKNYKVQTESLKQEIMSQEIELKSQISVLEKKAHENWVSARQAERKLEEAKQEAAQLRHRLTLRERALQEDKSLHRLQSPIEQQNGDVPVSPLESPASPLLFAARDHITKSPPLSGLPPFLPPPPGVPFMPPPIHGVPPFIPPPPPNMFPGDHRPPPLGRMSSPPLNSRYSPSSRGYSPYDRNSSSPSDSEYGTSPPHRRAFSPFNNRSDERRDFKRPPPRNNGRNLMKGGGSSGSGHSNDSLEKISRQQSKV